MSNEKFRVKFGLQVGDQAASIDAATGNILTAGDIEVGGTITGDLIGSVTGQVSDITNHNTDDLAEGISNLYYTDVRADARVAAGIALIDYPVDSVNGQTNTVVLDTDDVSEGTTNLYYTTARANADFDTQLATKTTDNLNEGTTNQYFTDARARQAISATDLGGDGSISYDNLTGVITYTGPSATEVRAHFSAGTGVTITDGSISIGQPVATTNSVTFADIVTTGNIDVRGGTITESTGALSITTGTANGSITLDPNGTGNVQFELANGGNVTNTRSYIHGTIRNATSLAAGDIWAVDSTIARNPFRGVSIANDLDTTRGPGVVLRSYQGAAGGGNRGRIVLERSRGTAAAPTAVQVNDILGSIDCTGRTSTGWVNDAIADAVPAFFGFQAAESWVSNTNLGMSFRLDMAPTATTIATNSNLIGTMLVNPQSFALRSDAFTWANGKTGTTQTMSLDVTGNLTITGDLRVNGNDIRSSDNTSQITTSAAGATLALKGNSTSINLANDTNISTFSDTKILNNRAHRSVVSTATLARGATYTPNGVNNFVELTLTAGTDPTYIDVDNLTVAGEGAHFAILIFNDSGSTIGVGDLRIRNNGVQISDSHSTVAAGARAIFTVYCVGNYASCEYMIAA